MAQANDVASYLVALRNFDAKKGEIYSLSNLKLQKLLYYCQGGHYQRKQQQLILDSDFEAWSYGPVIPQVYSRFAFYGRNEIPENEGKDYSLTEQEMSTIRMIWEQLKSYDAYTLVNATHSEPPWADAFKKGEKEIKEDNIRTFFRGDGNTAYG